MIHHLGHCTLRPTEPRDLPRLYEYKNDPEIAELLGGFHRGMAASDLDEWAERHRKRSDEVVWTIAAADNDACLGHVGLYRIDHRVRSAEFAILVGSREHWGRGLGREVTRFVLRWAFSELNLNRIHLSVLATNERAIHLYRSLGFTQEGCLRAAQYKGGRYLDVILMAVLRGEVGADD